MPNFGWAKLVTLKITDTLNKNTRIICKLSQLQKTQLQKSNEDKTFIYLAQEGCSWWIDWLIIFMYVCHFSHFFHVFLIFISQLNFHETSQNLSPWGEGNLYQKREGQVNVPTCTHSTWTCACYIFATFFCIFLNSEAFPE